MALTTTEGTKQKTMDIIASRLNFPAGTVKYARIFSSYKTRDNHPGKAFTANLSCYLQDNPGPDDQPAKSHEFGCNLPVSAVQEMGTTDDEAVLYKHVEYIINFQDAQRRQETDTDFDPVAEEAELQALATELGIESLFHIPQPETTTTE